MRKLILVVPKRTPSLHINNQGNITEQLVFFYTSLPSTSNMPLHVDVTIQGIKTSSFHSDVKVCLLTSNSTSNSYFSRLWMYQHFPNHLYRKDRNLKVRPHKVDSLFCISHVLLRAGGRSLFIICYRQILSCIRLQQNVCAQWLLWLKPELKCCMLQHPSSQISYLDTCSWIPMHPTNCRITFVLW